MENKASGGKIFSLGLQHVLAMYAGAILVPLLVGRALNLTSEQLAYLVGIDLLTCGIATFLQAWKTKHFGIGLPVMLGSSFVAITPMIGIGNQYGLGAVYGAIIAAGLFIVVFAGSFGKIIRLFPPVVTGTVVTVIGLSLVPTGIKNMAGGAANKDFGSLENFLLSFGVLAFILIMNRFFKGFMRSLSVLLGIIAGTLVAALLGKVNLAAVSEASWFHLPQLFAFGMPEFRIAPIITMIIVCMVIIVESTGVFLALGRICEQKLTPQDMTRGYRTEGLAIVLGGLFNAFPYNTFAQNVGLVELSRVKTRNVIFMASGILVVLGFVPKIAALATIIPPAVLGGATVVLFGMVIASGIRMLTEVDFKDQRNLLIVACSLSLGIGATVVPELFAGLPSALRIIVSDGTITGSLTAIVLNLFFHMTARKSERTTSENQPSAAETKIVKEQVS
ncbi:nucleobase:cation symporter-2 family protein [Paenibacillus hunanensis]|uniref:nucleobase:cation symporter-2 family protein n=1 Tax=Paenibacillus hunanensis TaxID=539262 RepID=UPI002A6AE81F|nr:nucleobase:cation symporter-2 family protein [Paenibacillus hunanensis]WPP40695.1 nucleobase:cation symporter-2 family protein [Paenibacillus hunanensis]